MFEGLKSLKERVKNDESRPCGYLPLPGKDRI